MMSQEKGKKSRIDNPVINNCKLISDEPSECSNDKYKTRHMGIPIKLDAQESPASIHDDPREIFSTEIWDHVFSYVNDSSDWMHCFYASEFFQLEPWLKWNQRRVLKLFPQVLMLLCESSMLTYRDYLDCRQVCKSWKQAVDNRLEYFTLQKCNNSSQCKGLIGSGPCSAFFVKNNECYLYDKNFFLSLPSSMNPFIGRRLTLKELGIFYFGQARSNDIVKLERILEKFGHHIHYLKFAHFDMFSFFSSQNDWYMTVRMCLKFMPNLKKLTLSYWPAAAIPDTNNEMYKVVFENPFPVLSNLSNFQATGLPICMINSAISNNKDQITRLKYIPDSLHTVSDIFGYLSHIQPQELWLGVNHMRDIYRLGLVNWPLHTLRICCCRIIYHYYGWSFADFITVVQHFKGTLKNLRLHLRRIDSGVNLGLPLLENLNLKCDEWDLDNLAYFVRPLESISKVILRVRISFMCLATTGYEKVREKYANDLFRLLPTLNIVIVTSPCYRHNRGRCGFTFERKMI